MAARAVTEGGCHLAESHPGRDCRMSARLPLLLAALASTARAFSLAGLGDISLAESGMEADPR